MDVEKLIERLKNYSIKDKALLNLQTVKDAAEALATLQIELKAMRGAANSYKAENARLESELEKVKAEKERFKEYAIDADNTMDSLYGACGKFCDDTILAFWDEWRGRKEE